VSVPRDYSRSGAGRKFIDVVARGAAHCQHPRRALRPTAQHAHHLRPRRTTASTEGGLNGTLNEWADNNGIHETREAMLERIHRRNSHHHRYRRPKPQRRLSQAAAVKLRRYRNR